MKKDFLRPLKNTSSTLLTIISIAALIFYVYTKYIDIGFKDFIMDGLREMVALFSLLYLAHRISVIVSRKKAK